MRYDIYIYIYVIRRLKVKLRSNMLSSNLIKKIHNFSVFLIFLRNTYFHLAQHSLGNGALKVRGDPGK